MEITNYSSDNNISGDKMVYPKSTLHELFAEQAEMFPNSIAVEFDDKQITYSELDRMINQMANYLWSQGLRPGQIVAVSLDRSPELIASLFAVLQCGASYVPIDTQYPDARHNFMIEDSDASFYIGLSPKRNFPNNVISFSITDILNAIEEFPIEPINFKATFESTAYIIYTSGSTGTPKGVQVAHYNVINFIYSLAKELRISANDKIFALISISFDPMVKETYLPLIFGACVVIVDEDTKRDGQLLLKKAVRDEITIMCGSPSFCQILLDSGWETSLNIKLLVGGEPLSLSLAHKLLSRCSELWNVYGPTETTVNSLLTQISINDNPISIGKPIANTQIYILDENRKPVNVGIVGEIAIAGDGVSLGYLNRIELTNERFIVNSFVNESTSKIYLTGDLGKILPNGHIQCLGRIDYQVKVRGYRIELGELEHALLSIVGIKSAVVLAKTDTLIAYIVADIKITNEREQIRLWRNELVSHLPTFMVPNVFYILNKIPITSNGKIDRKALLEYKSNSENKVQYTAPRTEEEKLVATIWKDCLNLDYIDIFSNFFELGGHSINAVKIIHEIRKHTEKKIPIATFLEHTTVEKFAKLLNTSEEIFSDCLVPLKPNGNKVPLFMIHGGGLDVLCLVNMSKYFNEDQPFYGLQGIGPKGYDDWYDSVEDMAAHYIEAIEKINPKGPYALAGFCVGGIVAFEMSRQLKAKGKEVEMLALLDSYADSSYYYRTLKQKKLVRYYARTTKRLIYLKEMLTSWKAFKKRFNAKKDYLQKRHFVQDNPKTEEEVLAYKQFTKALGMIRGILDRYHLKSHSFKVDLIRSKDHPEYGLAPTHLGWKKAALKGVSIHNIPGDNFDIRESPHDKVLAGILQEILDNRHASS